MNRERKILLASMVFALMGWVTAAALTTTVGVIKLRAVSAEESAASWKRQAGKAYTELLMAKSGASNTSAIIPKGSRIDCAMTTTVEDGRAISKCEEGVFYPPRDY